MSIRVHFVISTFFVISTKEKSHNKSNYREQQTLSNNSGNWSEQLMHRFCHFDEGEIT